MQIAICDDEKEFREELKDCLIEYKTTKRIHLDIYEFSDGDSLLASNLVFDIVFLDYQMPGIDGMKTAKILRSKNSMCSIIFVTNFPEFVYESFEVNPYRFFVKPLQLVKLKKVLDDFIKYRKQISPVVIVEDGEQKAIDAKDIIYLEGDGKYCFVRTSNDTFHSSKTVSGILELLPEHCFYRVHKSYAVNMYCVSSIKDNEVMLINGEKAVIGRKNIGDFKRVYKDFVENFYLRL